MKEKVKPDSVRKIPKRVQGTVLFTVVCVMMVLIVFLMGTLALAATANNRANFKYQKAQNESIARTVMESVVKAISEDNTNNGIRSSIVNATPFDMSVKLDGRDYPVSVSKNGTRSWYDGGQWLTGDVYDITATVTTLAGNEETVYTASMVLGTTVQNNPNPPQPGGRSGAFVSLGGINGTIGTAGMTTGGTEIGLNGTGNESYTLDNDAVQELPFYVNGNLTTASGCYAICNALGDKANNVSSYLAVTGNFTINNAGYQLGFDPSVKWEEKDSNGNPITLNYYDIPSVYVGKKLEALSGDFSFGNDNVPVNVYAGEISSDIDFFHKGDIYCFDENATSLFNGSQGSTVLYEWAKRSIINPDNTTSDHTFGNIYSRGNVTFGLNNYTHTIGGDVRVVKELKVVGNNSSISIDGDAAANKIIIGDGGSSALTVGKDLYADELVLNGDLTVTGNVYAKTISGTGTITANEIVTKTAFTFDKNTNAGSPTEAIPGITCTAQDMKNDEKAYPGNIYPSGYTQQEIVTNVLTVPDVTQYQNATDYPKTIEELNSKITILDVNNQLTIPTVDDLYWGDKQVATGQYWDDVSNPWWPHWETIYQTVTDSAHITSSCVLKGSPNCNIYVDTTVNNASIAIICDGFSPQDGKSIIVNENGGNVYFFVKNNGSTGLNICGGSIITTDYLEKATGKTTAEATDLNYIKNTNFKGMSLGTFDIYETPATGSPDFPYVYIYGEAGSSMYMGNNSLLVANVRAPYMDYSQGTATSVNGAITHHGSVDTIFNDYVGVVGQLICNAIDVSNEWGLIFVQDPSQSNPNPNHNPNPNPNPNPPSVYYSHNGSISYNIY